MDADEARERIRAKIAVAASVAPAELSPELTLAGSLCLDSLSLYALAAELEDEFGLAELDEEAVAGIETVGDVERRVLELLFASS